MASDANIAGSSSVQPSNNNEEDEISNKHLTSNVTENLHSNACYHDETASTIDNDFTTDLATKAEDDRAECTTGDDAAERSDADVEHSNDASTTPSRVSMASDNHGNDGGGYRLGDSNDATVGHTSDANEGVLESAENGGDKTNVSCLSNDDPSSSVHSDHEADNHLHGDGIEKMDTTKNETVSLKSAEDITSQEPTQLPADLTVTKCGSGVSGSNIKHEPLVTDHRDTLEDSDSLQESASLPQPLDAISHSTSVDTVIQSMPPQVDITSRSNIDTDITRVEVAASCHTVDSPPSNRNDSIPVDSLSDTVINSAIATPICDSPVDSPTSSALASPIKVMTAVLGLAVPPGVAMCLSGSSSMESLQFSNASSPDLSRKDVLTYSHSSVMQALTTSKLTEVDLSSLNSTPAGSPSKQFVTTRNIPANPSLPATRQPRPPIDDASIPCDPTSTTDVIDIIQSGDGDTITVCSRTAPISVGGEETNDDLLKELNYELEVDIDDDKSASVLLNGMTKTGLHDIPEYAQLKQQHSNMQRECIDQRMKLSRMTTQFEQQQKRLSEASHECDQLKRHLESRIDRSIEEVHLSRIKELEFQIVKQNKEHQGTRDKLISHDATAKRAVHTLQSELKHRVDQVTKMYEDCMKEKEAVVVKFAQAEGKNIVMINKAKASDDKTKDALKERQLAMNRMKHHQAERDRAHAAMENKHQETIALRKEVDRQRDTLSSLDVKTKWAHNKLKVETDSHKETRLRLDEASRKTKEVKEESEMIRRDCQNMIKKYQNSEEIKSNSLDMRLKDKEAQLLAHKQQSSDSDEVHHVVMRELDGLKVKHKDLLAEHKTYVDKVRCLDADRMVQDELLKKLRSMLQTVKTENERMKVRLDQLEDIEGRVQTTQTKIDQLELENEELKMSSCEIQIDIENCSKRESEHLVFTQKISKKNAQLQAANSALETKKKKVPTATLR